MQFALRTTPYGQRSHGPLRFGDVAQLVEHLLCKQGVVGSIPSISTRLVVARKDGGWHFAYPPYGSGVWVRGGFICREIRVSIFWFAVPAKVGGAGNWMFAPSFVVGGRIVLCQGE